jgi:HD-GYP domain-containing protein (c-di-GMP phosphodiesterase class II)
VVPIRSRLPIAGLLLIAALPPALALGLAGTHLLMIGAVLHFVVVTAAGLLAASAAIAMSVAAARRQDGHAIVMGTAFAVMAEMLVIHALATPSILLGPNGVVQLAGALNLPAGGTILAASSLPALRRPRRVASLLRIEFAIVAALAVIGAVLLVLGSRVPVVPAPSSLVAELIFATTAPPLVLLAWRAVHTFLLTRRQADLTVAVGVMWLIGAQYGLLNFGMTDAGFWVAHLLEFSGIGMVAIPVALDLRHAVASRPLAGDLHAASLVEHQEAFLGGRVRALLERLAEKDPSTEGHTRRVATLAVAIGEQLGLPESRLRQLALGGLLHDMGKLRVPYEILTKPGRLTDDEFAAIRRHPGDGRELLAELGGFSPLVLELVESHHERLDGAGYPHGVPAAQLALEVRVLTVADVFDALTADRVYREAWPVPRALALLGDETGTAFDGRCVAALKALLGVAAPAGEARTSRSARSVEQKASSSHGISSGAKARTSVASGEVVGVPSATAR